MAKITTILECKLCQNWHIVNLDVEQEFSHFGIYSCKWCLGERRESRWAESNKDTHPDAIKKRKEATKAWQKAHPEKMKEIQMRRLGKEYNRPGNFTQKAWLEKVDYYNWKCFYCGKQLDNKTLTCDHVKPISRGGSNFIANLVPACRSCNSRKHAKNWSKFRLKSVTETYL